MRPNVEVLGARDVPGNVAVGLSFENGVISAIGGDQRDQVTVWLEGDQYRVDLIVRDESFAVIQTQTLFVPAADATAIYFQGGAGGDSFANYTEGLVSWAWGGDGDDYLRGGQLADYLDGGAGNDQLRGYDGDDYLIGGPGVDYIIAHGGADLIEAGVEDAVLDW